MTTNSNAPAEGAPDNQVSASKSKTITIPVAKAVLPVLKRIGDVQTARDEEAYLEETGMIECIVDKNPWGIKFVSFLVRADENKIKVMGSLSFGGDTPEQMMEMMRSMMAFRADMIKAGYNLEGVNQECENYDMTFTRQVDAQDPAAVYAEVDKFVGLFNKA